MTTPRIAGVIPARYDSTRLPGKALALLGGRPLVQWVYEAARGASCLNEVIVATDDARIAESVTAFGGVAVMTARDHTSGTDRVAEAVAERDVDIVVNIQGDEPFIEPALIDAVGLALQSDERWDMATAATPISTSDLLCEPSVVKVVWDAEGRALYFSRSAIPHVRDGGDAPTPGLHWWHVGIYAYRKAFLNRLVATAPTPLEEAEKLEQLRALHIGGRIKVLQADASWGGIDTPADLARAEDHVRHRAERAGDVS